MSSGQKNVVINTLERALSTDINDIQAFIARDRNQTFRRTYQHADPGQYPIYRAGSPIDTDLSVLPAGATEGTVHDCVGGLMVRPDVANDLLIDPGTAAFFVPAFTGATPDDSPYIVVDSDGVQSAGVLTFTPNAGGGPRIDWIECRPVLVTTQQNRDVFDPVTQTFSSQAVNKETVAELEFRIRLGAPDGDFPDIDQEWMPLACCVVQVGAVGFTQCEFYDVRPLLRERTEWGWTDFVDTTASGSVRGAARLIERSITPNNTSETQGWCVAEYRGYRSGGMLWKNQPSTLANFGTEDDVVFDCDDTDNHVQGAGNQPLNTDGQVNYIMAFFPKGLGRFVRYSQNSVGPQVGVTAQNPVSGRLPRGFNGILALGRPSTSNQRRGVLLPSAVPSVLGPNWPAGVSTGTVLMGWLVGYSLGRGAGQYVMMHSGSRVMIVDDISFQSHNLTVPGGFPSASQDTTGSVGPSGSAPNLASSPNIPMQACRAFIRSSFNINVDGAGQCRADGPYGNASGEIFWYTGGGIDRVFKDAAGSQFLTTNAALEVPSASDPETGGKASQSFTIQVTTVGSQITSVSSATFSIVGWEEYDC